MITQYAFAKIATTSVGPELEDGEPYLKPVKRPALDEEASPTAGRRFTLT